MENEEEILPVPPKAQVYIDMLDEIDFKIDEFIDLHLLGAIRAEVEEDKKSEFLKEELKREYIIAELALDRARNELENAMESIRIIYSQKLF